MSTKVITRSNGGSAVAAWAYRSGSKIRSERDGRTHNYTRRGQVLEHTVLLPPSAPAWMRDAAVYWNAVESTEKRKDSQLAREIQVSLPHNLSLEQNRLLLREFIQEEFVARGMVAYAAIHGAHPAGDERNVHAHILLSMRRITAEGFGRKETEWNRKELLQEWRASWAAHTNRALERAGVVERVDHRSYVERGINREAEPKQGRLASKMEREGRRSRAGDDRRAVKERNAARARLEAERRAIDADIERARYAREMSLPESGFEIRGRRISERETALSKRYDVDLQGSDLARYYRIYETSNGLVFQNARSEFCDRGNAIVTEHGTDYDIRGMLDLALAKGWNELNIAGSHDFVERASAEARERGFQLASGLNRRSAAEPSRERRRPVSREYLEERGR